MKLREFVAVAVVFVWLYTLAKWCIEAACTAVRDRRP